MDNQTDNPTLIVDTDDLYEFDTLEELIEEEWNKLFENADYNLVSGSCQTWQGRRDIQLTLLDNDLESLMDKIKSNDSYVFEVYPDRVEVTARHHDGTNYYTCEPFYSEKMTLEQCKKTIEESSLEYGLELFIRDEGLKELSALRLEDNFEEFIQENKLDEDEEVKNLLSFLNIDWVVNKEKESATAMGIFKTNEQGELTDPELYRMFLFEGGVYDVKEEVTLVL